MSELKKRLEHASSQANKEQPDSDGLLDEGTTKVDKDGTTDTPNVNDGRTNNDVQTELSPQATGLKNSLTVGTNPAVADNSDNGQTSNQGAEGTTGVGAGNDVLVAPTGESATAETAVLTDKNPLASDAKEVLAGVKRGVQEGEDREVAASKPQAKSPFAEKALGDAAVHNSDPKLAKSVEGLEAFVPTPGSFKANRLPVFVTAKGLRIKPNAYGYYVKEELDNEQLELLRFYKEKGLVEEVIGA